MMADFAYENVAPLSRRQAIQNLAIGDSRLIATTLIALGLHDSDWRWVQNQCVAYLSHSSEIVVSSAILALAHSARISGAIEKDTVLPALEMLATDSRYVGRVQDAIDDIRVFVK